MIWNPIPSRGGLIGLAAIAAILALDAVCLLLLQKFPVSFWSFVLALGVALSLVALGILAYRVYGFYTLSYRLDRDALTITWGVTRQVVPLAAIQQVKAGAECDVAPARGWLRWPGYQVGVGQLPGLGATQFYATAPLDSQVILVTPGQALALSPADRNGFLADLEAHCKLGPSSDVAAVRSQPALFSLPAWSDRLAQAWLAAAVIANLALFAYIALRFPGLPNLLPLHFDPTGAPDRIGYRVELFRLPAIGLVVLTVNSTIGLLLHRRERLAAYVLLAAAFLTQLLLAGATHRIIH
jgi:hypothetical protein